MRVRFSEVFNVGPHGIEPRGPVQIGGITMTPGISFGSGVSFGGVDLAAIAGRDLEIEQSGSVVILKGHY